MSQSFSVEVANPASNTNPNGNVIAYCIEDNA